MRRLKAEIEQTRSDASRTTLAVQEIRVGREHLTPAGLLDRHPDWLVANLPKMQMTARIVAGDPVPLAPTRCLAMPKTGARRGTAEAVVCTVRRGTDGFVTIQPKEVPEAPMVWVRGLQGDIDVLDQESIFFLEQRLAVLRALRNDRAAPELEDPRRLPAPRRRIEDAATIVDALAEDGLGVIVGPPGTGKTQAISDIALWCEQQGLNCLLLAWTRIAVEEGLERVIERDGRARRLGRSRSPIVPAVAWDDDPDWLRILAGEEGLSLFGDRAGEPGILGMTFLQAFVRFLAEYTEDDGSRFDVVLVDEASQAPFEAILFAMMAGRRVVLLGDPIQLPPVYRAEDRLDAKTRKEAADCMSSVLAARSGLRLLLDTQYRAVPGLMDWSSKTFYGGMLRNGRPEDGIQLRMSDRPLPRIHVMLAGAGPSNRNNPRSLAQAKRALRQLAPQLRGAGLPERALYITPYAEQAQQAQRALEGLLPDMIVGTVDASQGKQAPVVVFDLCTSKETIFWQGATMARRFNVALTRATHHLILIVPRDLMKSARIPWLRSLLDHCKAIAAG